MDSFKLLKHRFDQIIVICVLVWRPNSFKMSILKWFASGQLLVHTSYYVKDKKPTFLANFTKIELYKIVYLRHLISLFWRMFYRDKYFQVRG